MVRRLPRLTREQFDQVYDAYEDLSSDDPLRSFINKFSPVPLVEAPEGLTPIGDNGLYATPDEPADPFDCDRFPSSPYCGSNPFSLDFISLEPSIIIDDCNIGIQLDGTFGFIKVPPVAIVYRKKECRNPPPVQEQEESESNDIAYQPLTFNELDCEFGIAGIFSNSFTYYAEYLSDYVYIESSLLRDITYIQGSINLTRFEYPYLPSTNTNTEDRLLVLAVFKVEENRSSSIEVPGFTKFPEFTIRGVPSTSNRSYELFNIFEVVDSWSYNSGRSRRFRNVTREFTNDPTAHYLSTFGYNFGISEKLSSRIGESLNFPAYPPLTYPGIYVVPDLLMGTSYIKNGYSYERDVSFPSTYVYIQANFSPLAVCDNPSLPPPPPPPPKPQCCMSCCPSRNNDDALLRVLIAKVNKLSEVIGVDDYPASLPASLISRDEGFLGNLIPNANKQIPSLTKFLAWYVERFDEVLGQWEIPIEIKDSDPSKPGDQPLGVKLPNLAEAIGEIFTLVFQTNLNSETMLNFAVRLAAETATDKQQNFITYKLVQSLAEWAGYKQKDIHLKMPLLFSLGKKRYDEILNESEVDVACVDFDEKFGLEADLMRFREAAAILQANYKRKVDPNGDIKSQILKHILDAYKATNKVNGDEDEDLDEFIREVEEGFKNVPGVTDPNRPYGRDYAQRPKIRDLTKNQPPTEP